MSPKTSPRHKAAATNLPVEESERHGEAVDSFIARNRDALNESIRRSREEVEKGVSSSRTIDKIIAEGRRRNSRG